MESGLVYKIWCT